MKNLMIASIESGQGKTVFTAALIRLLLKKNISVSAFKCGPDYIDPMFLERALKGVVKNLDIFLMGEKKVKESIKTSSEINIIEAAMGYYDGISGTDRYSAYEIKRCTDSDVLLLIKPGKNSVTKAAEIKGLLDFKKDSGIIGVVLTDATKKQFDLLKNIIERETGLPVLGFLKKLPEAEIKSRHLGLYTPDEIGDYDKRIDDLSIALQENLDIERLFSLVSDKESEILPETKKENQDVVIAVARDNAFSFYYDDNLSALERDGARLLFFSPLNDKDIPTCHGIYLGGGYPENYMDELLKNKEIRKKIRSLIDKKIPCVAECGGYIYLRDIINNDIKNLKKNDAPVRFGYLKISGKGDSMLFKKDEWIPAHEFHYFDFDLNGDDLLGKKNEGMENEINFTFGYSDDNIYAGFPHLYFDGETNLSKRFVEAARLYKKRTEEE